MGWRLATTLGLGLSIAAQSASAQPKHQVFVQAGYGQVAEDEGPLGTGPHVGGGVGVLLTDRWELVVASRRQVHRRDDGAGRFFHDGETFVVAPAVSFRFSRRLLQPFLRVGVSYARMEATRGFAASPFSEDERFSGSQAFFGPEVGVGATTLLRERFSIRPELLLLVAGSGAYTPGRDLVEPPLVITTLGIAVGYHW